MLSYSTDKGKKWSKPRRINDDPAMVSPDGTITSRDATMPTLAVNKDGVVGIMWYDRRDRANNLGYDVRFSASFDGGDTWTPSVRVSETPYDPEKSDPLPLMRMPGGGASATLAISSFQYGGGHTAGLAADAGGTFHPLWIGNSTGTPQLWSAPVMVEGTVAKNGGGDLADLEDVSDKIELRFPNRSYSRATQTIEADLVLRNVSADTIYGPLKLRVLALHSDLGTPEADGAGATSAGTVWDFSALLPGGMLAPKQSTGAKKVRVRIRNAGRSLPAPTGVDAANPLVLTGKALAKRVSAPRKQ
jgi:hypothetical protein